MSYVCCTCGTPAADHDPMRLGGADCCPPWPGLLVRVGSREWERWRNLETAARAAAAMPLDAAQIERDMIDLYGPKEGT